MSAPEAGGAALVARESGATVAPKRILVTGARDWRSRFAVRKALEYVAEDYGWDLVIVEGACPYGGADEFAHEWAVDHQAKGVRSERHPAPWRTMGKAAGPQRNSHMVSLGADLCVAFPHPSSVGTRDCMAKAEAAGIPVWNVVDQVYPPSALAQPSEDTTSQPRASEVADVGILPCGCVPPCEGHHEDEQ